MLGIQTIVRGAHRDRMSNAFIDASYGHSCAVCRLPTRPPKTWQPVEDMATSEADKNMDLQCKGAAVVTGRLHEEDSLSSLPPSLCSLSYLPARSFLDYSLRFLHSYTAVEGQEGRQQTKEGAKTGNIPRGAWRRRDKRRGQEGEPRIRCFSTPCVCHRRQPGTQPRKFFGKWR